MAATKSKAGVSAPVQFSKDQILASTKYIKSRDLVDALLDGGKKYTIEMVDKLINGFMKGKME